MHFGKGQKHVENDPSFKALLVNKGIQQPPSVNPDAVKLLKQRRQPDLTVEQYVNGIIAGDTAILSRAITLLESSLPRHQVTAREVIIECLPKAGKSVRVGITGVPGAGKSTFIEALGIYLIEQGARLAVLAIDPSSERTKGSILGDKTRMEKLSCSPNAYIRPSPSGGSLGGVARKTREAITLCEAAGFDTIFIETVGVGQSETAVHSMVDFFMLLMIAGAGDELQGIKRGIMEMADAIVINKADGTNIPKVEMARAQFANALHLFPPSRPGWTPEVETCSALYSKRIEEVWGVVLKYIDITKSNNYFVENRAEQSRYWMYESINQALIESFYGNPLTRREVVDYEARVKRGEVSSFEAARILLESYFKRKHAY